jgi:hypothetical protein
MWAMAALGTEYPMPRLEVICAVLHLHGVHHSVHRDDVTELGSEALLALTPLLRSYGFDPGRYVEVHQLPDRVLLTQQSR